MAELDVTTRFDFICTHCRQANEHRQSHASHLRPRLISIKCSRCARFNWLGWLDGIVEVESKRTVSVPAAN
jgi:hypothetical protein